MTYNPNKDHLEEVAFNRSMFGRFLVYEHFDSLENREPIYEYCVVLRPSHDDYDIKQMWHKVSLRRYVARDGKNYPRNPRVVTVEEVLV